MIRLIRKIFGMRPSAIRRAEALGYSVVRASPFEVGLTKNGRGLRTWFCADFDRKLPALDHPEIQRAIEVNEKYDPLAS